MWDKIKHRFSEEVLTDFILIPLDLVEMEFVLFLKLCKKSIKAYIKLACQYRVKQFSLIHGCVNLRVFLNEISLHYVCLFARFFYFLWISLMRYF
jgi:hypothetical protein